MFLFCVSKGDKGIVEIWGSILLREISLSPRSPYLPSYTSVCVIGGALAGLVAIRAIEARLFLTVAVHAAAHGDVPLAIQLLPLFDLAVAFDAGVP